MRRASQSILFGSLLAAAAGGAFAMPPLHAREPLERRWQLRGDGAAPEAVWTNRDGEPRASLRCDRGDPVLLLHIAPAQLPDDTDQLTLEADGIGMDYPAVHAGEAGLASRIALDAPILDRMLVARRFAVSSGGRTLATGSPGAALARVVRACRALHWPRDARIEPRDAGLAKK